MRLERIRITFIATALVALGPSVAAQGVGERDDVATVLTRVREAVGYGAWLERTEGLRLVGKATASGIEMEHELVINVDGRFRRELRGRLPSTAGYDGKELWTVDRVGLSRRLMLEDADRWRLVSAVLTGAWLGGKSPLELRMVGGAGDETTRLEATLAGTPMVMTLDIARDTWLPAALERASEEGTRRWELDDYRDVLGVRLPHRIAQSVDGNDREVLVVEQAGKAPAYLVSPYARPKGKPVATFDASVSPELEVRRAVTGHLLVHPRVNGKDIGWFIFDTGAGGMAIDPTVADGLELTKLGSIDVVGAAGRTVSSFREAKGFTLGPVAYADPIFVEVELAPYSPMFGVDLAGICGYDLFARTIVEIEASGPYVALHDPASYELPAPASPGSERAAWQELVLDDGLPCVRARFEGDHEGLFKIDTGNPEALVIHGPAVVRLGLLEGRKVERGQVGGVGGAVEASFGTLEWFELGGHRIESPQVTFFQGDVGALADDYTTGNIGQKILEPFRLVLDYPSMRMALQRIGE